MMELREFLTNLVAMSPWDGEDGVEAVEYALLGAMLVAIIVAINPAFSGTITTAYTSIANAITAAVN